MFGDWHYAASCEGGWGFRRTNRSADIVTYRLNWPGSSLWGEKKRNQGVSCFVLGAYSAIRSSWY